MYKQIKLIMKYITIQTVIFWEWDNVHKPEFYASPPTNISYRQYGLKPIFEMFKVNSSSRKLLIVLNCAELSWYIVQDKLYIVRVLCYASRNLYLFL